MASVAATAGAQTSKGDKGVNGNGNGKDKVVPVVPFIRASALHRERMLDVSRTTSASSDQDLGVFDVPAYGYLRAIILHVELTGGATSTTDTILTADAPFSAIKNITFQEPNGATITQFNNGYDLYLVNKYGGYRGYNDPRRSPSYSVAGAAEGNVSFFLRLPLEINERDGLGSLPNQNSGSNFKVRLTLSSLADVFTVPSNITTLPTARVRAYIETWDQPPASAAGMQNQVSPPAVNTTQYWMPQSYNINAGESSPRLNRVGNYIRNLLFVFRDTAGARTDDWPDPFSLMLDARPKDIISKAAWRQTMYERYGYQGTLDAPGGQDTGVWAYDFAHEFDGMVGHENRDLWLPTLMSTRLEPEGNYPASGTLHVLTNDVTTAGVVFM